MASRTENIGACNCCEVPCDCGPCDDCDILRAEFIRYREVTWTDCVPSYGSWSTPTSGDVYMDMPAQPDAGSITCRFAIDPFTDPLVEYVVPFSGNDRGWAVSLACNGVESAGIKNDPCTVKPAPCWHFDGLSEILPTFTDTHFYLYDKILSASYSPMDLSFILGLKISGFTGLDPDTGVAEETEWHITCNDVGFSNLLGLIAWHGEQFTDLGTNAYNLIQNLKTWN